MRGVLDESAPKRLAQALRSSGHDVSAFPQEWKGIKNGRLLTLLEASAFDCLLTCDKNLRFQQTIGARRLALLVLPKQRFEDLQPLLGEIGQALSRARHGESIMLGTLSSG